MLYMGSIQNIIFDKKGSPSLKIEDNNFLSCFKGSFYAGYIEKNRVHDFNGTQRGWFKNGVLRDLNGKCVGFVLGANGRFHPKFPPIKKTIKKPLTLTKPPLKPVSQEYPFKEPKLKQEWADKNPTTLMIP